MKRFAPTALLALSAMVAPATAQQGVLDQDNTIPSNVAWNMGFFNDFQQQVQVGITGQLVGFKIRMASQNIANGLPVAVFRGSGPFAPTATPDWSGEAFVTRNSQWEEVILDVSAAELRFNSAESFVIRVGDAVNFTPGMDLTGNQGFPNPFYPGLFWENGQTPIGADRLYFQTFVVPCSSGTVAKYGTTCPGAQGLTPNMTFIGCPQGNAAVTVEIDRVLGGANGVMFFGSGDFGVSIGGGCELNIVPFLPVSLPMSASGVGPGNGTVSLPAVLPPIPGVIFTMQAFFFDPLSPINISATNALRVNVG